MWHVCGFLQHVCKYGVLFVVVPSMCETTALGAAMAAGAAEGIAVWDLNAVSSTIDTKSYKPSMSHAGMHKFHIFLLTSKP